jgi:hypothetical protein
MEINSNALLSVILIAPTGDAASIEAALLSVMGQVYRPCEVVLVIPTQPAKAQSALHEECIARWKAVFSSFTVAQMVDTQASNGAWYALGLRQVTGKYLAFMDDAQRIYPYTYFSLIDYLQNHQECTWAFANIGIALVNDERQVVKRIDPDPTHDYVGVDYLEKEAIRLPGVVIDRTRLPGLFNLEILLSEAAIAQVIALLTLEAKPGHIPMLGGEIRTALSTEGVTLQSASADDTNDAHDAALPWWLSEFQMQNAKLAELNTPIRDPSLHQTLSDAQSIYYRQLYMAYRQSTSGKIVRVLLRNYAPAKAVHAQIAELPKTEIEAINKIFLLQSHPLWELTAPVRWLGKLRAT